MSASVTENYSYDAGDKLIDIKIGGNTVKSFGYDAAGRTTSITTSAGTTSLAYDYESRITGMTFPNNSTNAYGYNGFNTRVSKTDSVGTHTYKRAGAGVTAPVLEDGFAAYTPGISERRSNATTYYHSGLKNVERQTDSTITYTAQRQHDAFGNVVSSGGTWKSPFGYGGHFGYQEDKDSGLRLLGHRYYDSSTGRFLTRDPIKDGRNWYGYCENRPVVGADPEGLVVWFVPVLIGVGAVSLGYSTYQLIQKGRAISEAAKKRRQRLDDVQSEDHASEENMRGTPVLDKVNREQEDHRRAIAQVTGIIKTEFNNHYGLGVLPKFFTVRHRAVYDLGDGPTLTDPLKEARVRLVPYPTGVLYILD